MKSLASFYRIQTDDKTAFQLMLCHFFKLSRPAPVPASFKLLLSFHLFPFLLTYSAHAIGRWATFKSSGLGLKSFGHMHAHGLSTCALVHTYTWDMSIRQRLVSHGLCLRSAHGPCSCVRCYQLQLWFTLCVTLPTCWTFLLACPTTPPGIHREFCSENADWTSLTQY